MRAPPTAELTVLGGQCAAWDRRSAEDGDPKDGDPPVPGVDALEAGLVADLFAGPERGGVRASSFADIGDGIPVGVSAEAADTEERVDTIRIINCLFSYLHLFTISKSEHTHTHKKHSLKLS